MAERRKVLEVGDGIFLRQYVIDDAPMIFGLINTNREHLSQHREDTAKKYPTLESVAESITNPPNPERLRFGIWDREIFVGGINITPASDNTIVLGYFLGKIYQGKGYAIRASRRIIRFTFGEGSTKAITAKVFGSNTKSSRLLIRLGFIETAKDSEGYYVYTLEKWLPFYLDSLHFYGLILNRAKWEEVVIKHYGNLERLKGMHFNTFATDDSIPDFGEGARYTSWPTLGQWAKENGMKLD